MPEISSNSSYLAHFLKNLQSFRINQSILQSRPCSSKIFNHQAFMFYKTMQVLPQKLFITSNLVHAPPKYSIIKLLSYQASTNANLLFQNIFYHPISSMLLQSRLCSSNLVHAPPSFSVIKHPTMSILFIQKYLLSSNLVHAPPQYNSQ